MALIGGCEVSSPPVESLDAEADAGGAPSRNHPAFRDRSICRLPESGGDCGPGRPSHWYNPVQRRCQESSIGSCEANDNQFPSLEMCEAACGPQGDVSCDLITCPSGSCLYFRGVAMCLEACIPFSFSEDGGVASDRCEGHQVCECVPSCPTCTDCARRCVPRWWGGPALGMAARCEALACPTGTECRYARLSGALGDRGPSAFCLVPCPEEGGACPAGQTCGDVATCQDCSGTERRCVPTP
jgi:hypothetical protein